METLRIYPEEQLLIKYYVIKHLMLQKIQNMMDINLELLHWFINFLIKSRANKFAGSGVKSEIMPYQELAKEIHKTIIKQFENQKV